MNARRVVAREASRLLHDPDWRVRISAIVATRQEFNCGPDEFLPINASEQNHNVRSVIDAIRLDNQNPVGTQIVAALDGDDWRAECLTSGSEIVHRFVTVGRKHILFLAARHCDDHIASSKCRGRVLYMSGNHVVKQELTWPRNRFPEDDIVWKKRSVREVSFGSQKLLMVLADDLDSGTWECMTPLLFQYRGGRWKATQKSPDEFRFSCRGDFAIRGNRLSVFDFDYTDGSYAHPQPYKLKRFYFLNGEFHPTRTLKTRRRYFSPRQRESTGPCPANEDPLHEFGLRWSSER